MSARHLRIRRDSSPIAAAGARTAKTSRAWWLAAAVLLGVTLLATGAKAAVDLRVEARPIESPIEAFITVTDDNGDPVPGLTADDFTVTLDGNALSFGPDDLALPPSQDVDQKVSVIFVMDYSSSTLGDARIAMQDAVVDFIGSMNSGDYAAIIKFNATQGAAVVQTFTVIDDNGDSALVSAATAPYEGSGTNLLDAIALAVTHYNESAQSLPPGPKAVIVLTDGGETASTATETDVINAANEASLPLFTIGIGDLARDTGGLLDLLPDETGGNSIEAPTTEEIAGAYATISQLLDNEYLLTFQSSISDCNDHTLTVSVTGQATPETEDFSRCSPEPAPVSGGGGGGGSIGLVEFLAALGALAIRRRRCPT